MKKAFIYTLVFVFFLALAPHAAKAASITCGDDACETLWISGEIVSGDALKFASVLEKNANNL